jgi:hypothetical protein
MITDTKVVKRYDLIGEAKKSRYTQGMNIFGDPIGNTPNSLTTAIERGGQRPSHESFS